MNEKKNSLKKPWNKLDTGMKLNRIKLFVENQKETNNLSTEEYEKHFTKDAESAAIEYNNYSSEDYNILTYEYSKILIY